MRQLCRQRFEREFPIFPVSAKKAYLARSGGVDRDRLLAESGFPPLEAHISRAIGGSGQRLGKLGNALHSAGGVLAAAATRSGTKIAAREEKTRALRQIEYELMQAEDRTNTTLASAAEAVESDFKREAGAILTGARDRLTTGAALRSVIKERRSVSGLERSLLDRVQAAGADRWTGVAAVVQEDVCAAASRLGERIAEDLKVQMRDELRPDPAFWEAQRHRFASRVEELLQSGVHRLGLELSLEPALARSRKAAAGLVLVALAALGGASALAVQQYWAFAGGVLACGVLFSAVLWAMCSRGLARAEQSAAERLAAAAPELRTQIAGLLRDEVRNLYGSLTRYLQPMRDKLAEQEARQTALQTQLHAMEQAFHGLDRELDSLLVGAAR
jgi:hypothetical protein